MDCDVDYTDFLGDFLTSFRYIAIVISSYELINYVKLGKLGWCESGRRYCARLYTTGSAVLGYYVGAEMKTVLVTLVMRLYNNDSSVYVK